MTRISLLIGYIFLFAMACVDTYKIPNTPFDAGILVIDGFVNSNAESTTTITLSRSTPIAYSGKLRTELKAKVTVEASDNSSYVLAEKGNGAYSSLLKINAALTYRLRVKTLSGQEYLSDFVKPKHTPPIDSITYELDKPGNAVRFYLHSHDATNSARNYYWDVTETWEYHADCNLVSSPVPMYRCWKSEVSGNVLYFSTNRLEQDVVNHFPLNFVDANSIKVSTVYSMLVKQLAVTEEALIYLQQLKKTTEQRGSIFDAQPSSVTGNFHNVTSPEEPVLGYLFVTNVTEKRIFVENRNLPGWFYKIPAFLACSDPNNPFLPTPCPAPPPVSCSDCRVGGGVITRPDYWIY